jgi:hypothetical protein
VSRGYQVLTTTYKAVGDCQYFIIPGSRAHLGLEFGLRTGHQELKITGAFSEISRSFISDHREGMALAFDRVYAGERF